MVYQIVSGLFDVSARRMTPLRSFWPGICRQQLLSWVIPLFLFPFLILRMQEGYFVCPYPLGLLFVFLAFEQFFSRADSSLPNSLTSETQDSTSFSFKSIASSLFSTFFWPLRSCFNNSSKVGPGFDSTSPLSNKSETKNSWTYKHRADRLCWHTSWIKHRSLVSIVECVLLTCTKNNSGFVMVVAGGQPACPLKICQQRRLLICSVVAVAVGGF